MRLFKRKPPSPFTWRQRVTGEARVALQDKDISSLRTLAALMESLASPPLHSCHPLRGISQQLKQRVQAGSYLEGMRKVEEYVEKDSEEIRRIFTDYPLEDKAAALATDKFAQIQTSLRLINLQYYCKNLKEMSESGESVSLRVGADDVKYMIDLFLLGSGAERVSGHLHLIGRSNPSFTQGLLQSSYYSILEPEVATVSEAANLILASSKDHVKTLKKMTPVYLLDKLELNVKSRCVFAWSDPKYIGYQPLDDDQVVAGRDIFVGSYKYFPEVTSVGKHFVDKYISDQQSKYHDANETRSNLQYGAVFFVVTCLLDAALGVM